VTELDPEVRDLLWAIYNALLNPRAEQRFRVAAALGTMLVEGSTVTAEWTAMFIRRGPGETGDPPLVTRPHDWPGEPQ